MVEWTSAASYPVTISTQGSSFHTLLAVYTGSEITALVPAASNDNSGGATTSSVTFSARAGVDYRIAVDGFNGATGDVTLTLSQPVRPPNDDFASAQSIPADGTTLHGSSPGATSEPGEWATPTVWYTWAAPYDGRVDLPHRVAHRADQANDLEPQRDRRADRRQPRHRQGLAERPISIFNNSG